MEGIINFHHDLFFFLTMILTFVVYMLVRCIQRFNNKVNKDAIIVTHAPTIEII
jgi:cytochrome c oxidase subunit 2